MSDPAPALIEQFAAVLDATGGSVLCVDSVRDVADAIARVAAEQGTRQVLYEPFDDAERMGLRHHLAARNIELITLAEAGHSASEVTVGFTTAELAVAESGTLLVGGQPGPWGLVSILPWVHIVLIRAEEIVADLATAFSWFLPRLRAGEGDWVWITGPSRTADIGHTLVMGAHGPNALHVLVLGDRS